MPKKHSQPAAKARSDARQNRDRILEVAKTAFTRQVHMASLDDIANRRVWGRELYTAIPDARCPDRGRLSTEVEKRGQHAELSQTCLDRGVAAWMMLFIDYMHKADHRLGAE